MFSEDDLVDTPPIVIGAIACGVAPIPFLLTYSAIFLMHATIFPVDPPDITSSRLGEGLSGVVTFVYMIAIIASIGWFLSRHRRWPFIALQALSFGIALDFIIDETKGSPEVPLMLIMTTTFALILALLPTSWHWVRDWRYDPELVAEVPGMKFSALLPGRKKKAAALAAEQDAFAEETFVEDDASV